jgi:hypothetical protein
LSRIANESRKKRERTEERDHWKAEAEKLAAQLQQQVQSPVFAPGVVNPVAHILDGDRLTELETLHAEALEFAEENPDGVYDYLLGTNPDGSERRADFPVEKIREIKRKARLVLRNAPKQFEHIKKVQIAEAEAKKVYPEIFDLNTQAGRQASAVLQNNPWLLQHPDYTLAIGDYLDGLNRRLGKQGKTGSAGKTLSASQQAILGASKVTPAPGVIKSRSASAGPQPAGGNGSERVDQKQAREELVSQGFTAEAMEDYIAKLRLAQGATRGGIKPTLA